jgi:calcineurin-like phosphoesterase family protein
MVSGQETDFEVLAGDSMSIWFTSDTHFGHANILKYDRRPFMTIEEHDEELIRRWNTAVKPGDTVYHLGDVAWHRDVVAIDSLLGRLHGTKILILGNHDEKTVAKSPRWAKTTSYHEISVSGQKICLFHYRMVVWNRSHHGSWALHGHSHGTLPVVMNAKTLDVGTMCWAYAPVSFEEIKEEMAKRTFVPVDAHTGIRD